MNGLHSEALGRVTTRQLNAYLTSSGWRQVGRVRLAEIWMLDTHRVLLPESDVNDYPERVADLVHILAAAEDRAPLAVYADIALTSADITYVQTHPNTPPGTTPLADGVLAVRSAYDLLLAAACTVVLEEPRLVLPSKRPKAATEVVQRARLGPTGAGSFILSIHLPMDSPSDLSLFAESSDPQLANRPFERQVTLQLHQAVLTAGRAAAEALAGDSLDAFAQSAGQGVSANLCEALVGLAGSGEGRLTIRFAWNAEWPMQYATPPVEFPAEYMPILREAGRELRTRDTERGVIVTGHIVLLHREASFGAGEVTIAAVLPDETEGRIRRVRVRLEEAAYDMAVRAHREGIGVSLEGELVRHGNYARLQNLTRFELMVSD